MNKTERSPTDFYPTPPALAAAALRAYAPDLPGGVLDPGAGSGHWGAAVRAHYRRRWEPAITGVDLFVPRGTSAYDYWHQADFLTWPAPITYSLIVGNPPYSQAEAFVRRAWDLLWPGGSLIFLLRLSFLASQARGRGLWRTHPPAHVGICVSRPSFTGDGATDNSEYAVFHWVRDWHEAGGPPRLDWLDWQAPANGAMQLALFGSVA